MKIEKIKRENCLFDVEENIFSRKINEIIDHLNSTSIDKSADIDWLEVARKAAEGSNIDQRKAVGLEQSTSLKKEICTLIKEKDPTYQDEREDLTNEILSLVKQHLKSEIEKEPNGIIGTAFADGRRDMKKDIIKLIDNL